MTVPDDVESRILEKAAYVEEAITVLAEKRTLSEEAYRTDREQRAIVEREFQTAIEACIDIAGLVIGSADASMPETYAGRFRVLGELGVCSQETSEQMRKAAGFRNVLVHRYGAEIDDASVYQHLQEELVWLVRFLREVREYLEDSSNS